MKLNRIEKALMNNPVRGAIQRWYESALLQRLGGRTDGQRVLEIGCGRGIGTEIILQRFGARTVSAFDLDPDMVAQARTRLERFGSAHVQLAVGDATAIAAPSATFDAVFDFGTIHHVPAWHAAVAEVRRVLRPGGRFFFEEVTRHALERWSYRTFLEHPEADRFSGLDFVAELERQGLIVGRNFVQRFFGDFVIGVAVRSAPA
jgi:ubiquinone/menaquinone biosynthesis C-methylase UbiE